MKKNFLIYFGIAIGVVAIAIVTMQFMTPTIGNVFSDIGSGLEYNGRVSNFLGGSEEIAIPEAVDSASETDPINDTNTTNPTEGNGVDANLSEDSKRIVIMSAKMTISSHDPETVIDSVANLATRYGGFVVSSNLRQLQGPYGAEVPEANITIRVPADRLQQAVETIKGLANEVIYASQWGQDVTREYTDLQSRLKNLEEAAAQLQAIMDTANKIDDVLTVYDELTAVNEEAEVIRGQIQYYDQASAFSSIELTIIQIMEPTPTPTLTPSPTPEPTTTPQPWLPGETFDEASEELNSAFQGWTDGMIKFFVYFLPTFLLRVGLWLILLFFVGRWAFRRFYKPNIQE